MSESEPLPIEEQEEEIVVTAPRIVYVRSSGEPPPLLSFAVYRPPAAPDIFAQHGGLTNPTVAQFALHAAFLVLICILMTACAPEQLDAGANPVVQTVPLHVLARDTGSYRGQTVRTCGRELRPAWRPSGEVAYWILSIPDPTSRYKFPAEVIIPSCNGGRPALDEGGCVTGRIAREEGSLEPPDTVTVSSHRTGSYEWWLHPQCPPRDGAE